MSFPMFLRLKYVTGSGTKTLVRVNFQHVVFYVPNLMEGGTRIVLPNSDPIDVLDDVQDIDRIAKAIDSHAR